jgi:hypothetical protein
MAMGDAGDNDPIAATYRQKLRELRRIRSDGDSRIAHERAGAASPELVVRAAVPGLQDEVLAFAKQAVAELALTHVRYSRMSAAGIAEEIRTRFVDEGLNGGVPAGGLFREPHGFAAFSANGHRLKADSEARFNLLRRGLSQEVSDVVARTLAENPRKTRAQELADRWKGGVVALIIAAILGLAALVAAGTTLKDALRDWLGYGAPATSAGSAKAGGTGALAPGATREAGTSATGKESRDGG